MPCGSSLGVRASKKPAAGPHSRLVCSLAQSCGVNAAALTAMMTRSYRSQIPARSPVILLHRLEPQHQEANQELSVIDIESLALQGDAAVSRTRQKDKVCIMNPRPALCVEYQVNYYAGR